MAKTEQAPSLAAPMERMPEPQAGVYYIFAAFYILVNKAQTKPSGGVNAGTKGQYPGQFRL